MRVVAIVVCLLLSSLASADPPKSQYFALYKFGQQIGMEQATDDGRQLRTVFTFTDRSTQVPLASVLERGKDGAPLQFQIWGFTARGFPIDDKVVVEAGKLTITQRGQ